MVITSLETSIVRILSSEGFPIGAGFLIDNQKVITCAHVIQEMLGTTGDSDKLLGNQVNVDFPLVSDQIFSGRVIFSDFKFDIVGIEIVNKEPWNGEPVSLVFSENMWGHFFRTLGFPKGYEHGVWASGILRGQQAKGWIQIEDVKQTGYFIAPGFSGSPVWDEQLNGIVGMIVAADSKPDVRVAYIIPTQIIIQAWPEIKERSIDADGLDYLKVQLSSLQAAQQRAKNPLRFKTRIDELMVAIADWDYRIQKQEMRVASGLERTQKISTKTEEESKRKPISVVGQRPLETLIEQFRDRINERKEIKRLLSDPNTRLVSIIGHGGIGKTALASRVLRDLELYQWPQVDITTIEGIIYLSTRTTGINLERIFLDCAKILNDERGRQIIVVWAQPKKTIEEKISYLLSVLQDGRFLILLDNIEDLLDRHGNFIDDNLRKFFEICLTTPSGTQLLVTSRQALKLNRSILRYDKQVKLLEGLPVEDGVQFLYDLDPNGTFGILQTSDEQLSKAVALLHGVPRALEVLVGILANNPFASLSDILSNYYKEEDVVQDLIEENYNRLDSEARKVIDAMAVFRRPISVFAIDYLLQPFASGLDVPRILTRLTQTNIVSVDRDTKNVALHPIDQDYAYSQLPLEEDGVLYTRKTLELRAAGYYRELSSIFPARDIDDLQPQLLLFEHLVNAKEFGQAFTILGTLDSKYLSTWGYYVRLVEMRQKLVGHLNEPLLEADNFHDLAHSFSILGNLKLAVELYTRSKIIAQQERDQHREGRCLGSLGKVYRAMGQDDEASRYFNEALVKARAISNRKLEGEWLAGLGSCYRDMGKLDIASTFYKEAIAIASESGDRKNEARGLSRLGVVYRSIGQFEDGIELHRKSLSIAQDHGNRLEEAIQLCNIGDGLYALGNLQQSEDLCMRALTIGRDIEYNAGVQRYLSRLASIELAKGNFDIATHHFQEALTIARNINDRRGESYQLIGISRSHLANDDITNALSSIKEALELDIPQTSFEAAVVYGMILLHQQDKTSCIVFQDATKRCRHRLSNSVEAYRVQYTLATSLVGEVVSDEKWVFTTEHEELLAPAIDEYRKAMSLCNAKGIVNDVVRDIQIIQSAGISNLEIVIDTLSQTG